MSLLGAGLVAAGIILAIVVSLSLVPQIANDAADAPESQDRAVRQ